MSKTINPYRLFVGAFIPNWLMRCQDITHGAKMAYARLCQYADKETGEAWPSQDVWADEIGVSVRQLRRYVEELEGYKLIQTVRRGLSESNVYRFLEHPLMSGQERTDMSSPDGTHMSGQERTRMSDPLLIESREKNHRRESCNGDGHSFIEDTTSRVIAYLNQTAGRRFDPTGGNCKHLRARVREAGPRGAEVFEANARRVIDLKVNEWGSDAKMSKFLRPETLFNSEKWPTYLEESSRSSNGRYLMTPADIEREAANLR